MILPGTRTMDHSGTILNVGFDDTDSPVGMCTTFLAYKIAGQLRGFRGTRPASCSSTRGPGSRTAQFLDYPRLVRFNPNVPWKTRGNGAVSMRIITDSPQHVKQMITDMVFRYADTENGANPGLVFFEGDAIPDRLARFARLALWQLVGRSSARRLARETNLEVHYKGNGQGLVGAIGAVGYEWDDHTLELLSYRRSEMRGTPRIVSAASIMDMQARTSPHIFNSFDERRGRVLITPRGPDPVFYGIRGDDASVLVDASHMVQSPEKPEGYMIFRTNQGTGAHLRNEFTANTIKPYASGWIRGAVTASPATERGGHVFFEVAAHNLCAGIVTCAVYKPTKLTKIARALVPGDILCVGGGIRKASKNHPRVLNVEYLKVETLARCTRTANPECLVCGKRMKSKGVGQGYECPRCKEDSRADSKVSVDVSRSIKSGLYIPDASAQRHLTRPVQRLGVYNRGMAFDDAAWLHIYKSSGE